MSISFSGLASGLDTSSWVESLVALKKAKVETYEEEKSKIQTTQETLSKIKSFFTSFRSMLEKVTDAKFGVGSMDIFAQKLATSSDTSILTAAATTEAEEASYEINVDKLATGTQAVSGFKNMTTVIQSETATMNTKLSAIGVKAGDIGVTVNGTKHTVTIGENDTISNFITKMKNIGVDASYSEASGVFSINLSSGAIDDTLTKHADGSVGTGIVEALHLKSTGGYESSDLKLTNTETIVAAATGGTKLSELGTIKSGNIQVKANNTSYNIAIDGNTTLASIINNLQSKGIEAKLTNDGVFQIKDAEIVDVDNTGIITALGLQMDVNSKTQTATGLKTVSITTTESAATGSTKISQLGTIKNGNVQVKANGSTYTIAIDQNTTLSGLVSALTSKGVDASLSSDGVFTINNAEIVDSGNTGLVSALGLTTNVSSKTQTSSALKTVKTITTESAATGSTKISQLGTVKNGAIQVKANDATYTYTIDQNTTLSGLMNFLAGKGVTATLDSDGNFSIANAEIIDSGNTGIISALGLTRNVDSTSQTSGALSVKTVITNKTTASGSTLIKNLVGGSSLKNNDTIIVQSDNDKITTITLQTTSTLDNLVTALNNAGLSAALSSGGEFSIDKGKIIGGSFDIMEALGLNTVQTVSVNATSATKLSNITSERVFSVKNVDGNVVTNVTLGETATIGDLFTKLSENGISASISNGVITLNSTNGNYITGALPKALGIDVQVDGTRTITTGSTATSGEPVHYETQVAGTTTVTTSTSTTSSDRLTYSTVISNSTTSTVANDITSSGAIYYTTVVSSASGGITPTPDTGTNATLVSSSAVIVTHVTSATNSTGDIKSGQAEIVVTNPLLLSNAISTYNTIGIGDAATLAQLATIVNKGISCAGKTIVLTADIDLSGYKSGSGWTPIGNGDIGRNDETGVFSGTFDGNGHTISNLYIEAGQGSCLMQGVGLFGSVYAGTIKNVGLKNESVTGKNNDFRYGGLVGVTKDATINNCYTTGSVSVQNEASSDKEVNAGGLIGSSENTIINNSYSATNVTATNATGGDVYSGGLVASGSNITINNSYSAGNVSASSYSGSSTPSNIHSGGLVASGSNITINNSYSAGNISTSTTSTSRYCYHTAGGLVGYSNKVNIYNSFVLGKVDRYATSDKAEVGDIKIGAVIGGIWRSDPSDSSYMGRITSVYYNNANSSDIGDGSDYIKPRDTYAIEKSSFNQDFYKSIGYDESNGWIYPSSSSSPAQASFYYLNSNTTLKDLLGDSCSAQTVIVQNSSGLQTVVINKTDAIMKKLSDAGLDVSVSDGILTVKGDVISISQGLSDALKLKNSSSDSGNNGGNGSGDSTETKTTMSVAITSSSQNLKLTEIGLTKTNYITVKNGNTTATVTLTTTSTVADLISGLAGVGITTDVTNGKFTFSGDNTHYILGMTTNLKSALNLVESGGKGYTIQTVQTSSTQTVTLTSADTSIKLGALGLTGTNFITVQNGNTTATVIVDTTSTLTDMTNALAQFGISTNISDGKITFSGDSSHYIVGISSNLASALKLSSGSGKTYTTTVTSTNTTQTLTVSGSNSTVNLSAIGATKTNYITVKNGTTTTVITLATNSTIANMTSALTAAGIDVDVTNGIFTFTGDNTHYILGMSANLANILNFGAGTGGGYVTTVENTYSNTNSNALKNNSYNSENNTLFTETTTTQTIGATRDTLLSSLGVTAGEFYIYKDGVKNLAVVSSDETLGSLLDKLSAMGIQAGLINNGTSSSLILNAQGDTYIAASEASGASNILTQLFDGQTAKGNVSYQGKENVKSTSTQTVAADRSGLLSAYGVTAGELYVYQNGERHTVQISSDETIGSLIDTLAGYGLKAELVKNGNSSKIVLSGSGDSYIAKSNNTSNASNIVDTLFGGSSAVVNESSYTGVESITTRVTATIGATESTALSSLGVTAGEYYIYNNGVKYTALISSEETLGSFMNTLKSFGIQTGLINNGNATNLLLIGSGNSYIAKSNSVSNASNVVEKLFGASGTSTSYSYTGSELLYSTVTHTSTATTDSLLSEFDTPWGGTTLKSAGDLVVMVNGETKTVRITDTETFGSLVDKLKGAGIQSDFLNGKLYITNAGDLSVIADRTTSALFNPNSNLKLTSKSVLNGFMSSTATVQSTTTIVEEHSASASAYADMNTKLSTLGITSGSLSIYRNGEKALINIEASHTLGDVRSLISQKFSNVDMKFDDNGKLVFYSTDKDVSVELGNTTDTSNFLAVTGVTKTKDGTAESARALYTVNGESKVMADGIFRRGKVTAGSFIIGTERIEINANTTINDLVATINNAEGANATAYWDTIDGKLVIKSRSSGAALINIEAGTSNFTDIMGYTTSEWNADGSLKVSRMNVDTQDLGSNAQFRINGTSYTATSNTITSDITRIKGVTLNLNGLTSGSSIKVTVEKDKESVASALSDIVDSYNELMSNVDDAIAKDGALKNQTTLKMIRNQLRSLMTSSDLGATTFRNLSAIGISVEAASASNISTSNSSIINLNFDKEAFFKAYEADADAVKALLIGGKDNKGIFTNVETIVENALQSVSGYFAVTESAYNRELTNLNSKITKSNKEIDRYKSRLEKKFSSMDLTISQMQQQYSSFLS